MAHAKEHDYHILPPSVLPFLGALSAFGVQVPQLPADEDFLPVPFFDHIGHPRVAPRRSKTGDIT